MTVYNTTDFTIVFLSYDEPNAEKNWAWLKKHVPTAERVHGVKGFDTAHQTCGRLSKTDRVITIDGDNFIDPEFFKQTVEIDDAAQCHDVFSWSGKNSINGLCYGNGGIKLWPVDVIKHMNSHENSTDDISKVDFCWHLSYMQMPETFSDTVVNDTPYQAFRAGFREGTKMCLDRGVRASKPKFTRIGKNNLDRLAIWCTIGNDVKNGDWAILGARLGCYKTMLTDWDFGLIADYDWFEEFWEDFYGEYKHKIKRHKYIAELGDILRADLHFNIAELDADASKFFKGIWVNPERKGLMLHNE